MRNTKPTDGNPWAFLWMRGAGTDIFLEIYFGETMLNTTSVLPHPIPYKSDNGFKISGLAMLFGAMVIAGGVLGWVAHFIHQFFWLIILFPAVIGLFMGAVGVRMCTKGHVRNRFIGGLAGLFGGMMAMFCMHYFGYEQFKKELIAKVPAAAAVIEMSEEDLQTVAREDKDPQAFLDVAYGLRSFKGFMDYKAKDGVRISGRGSGSGFHLGYKASYFYWIVEVLVVGLVTLAMVREQCEQPYCPTCEEWKTSSLVGGFSGDINGAMAGLSSGDVQQVAMSGPSAAPTSVNLYRNVCPRCQGAHSPTDLKLVVYSTNGKGETSQATVQFVTWPTESAKQLAELFKAPVETKAEPTA